VSHFWITIFDIIKYKNYRNQFERKVETKIVCKIDRILLFILYESVTVYCHSFLDCHIGSEIKPNYKTKSQTHLKEK